VAQRSTSGRFRQLLLFQRRPDDSRGRGFEVPDAPGIKLHDLLTVSLGGVGIIDHVVNNTGAPAQGVATIPSYLAGYP
jgi:hypothetical protein